MANFYNTSFRSVVRGSVSVSYLDGNGSLGDGLFDVEVGGNVSFQHGSGFFTTYFEQNVTAFPVLVRGNVTVAGTSLAHLNVGTQRDPTPA